MCRSLHVCVFAVLPECTWAGVPVLLIICSIVSRGILRGLPLRGRSRRPSRPPSSYRCSQLRTHLADRMRWAAVSSMPALRTWKTMCTSEHSREPPWDLSPSCMPQGRLSSSRSVSSMPVSENEAIYKVFGLARGNFPGTNFGVVAQCVVLARTDPLILTKNAGIHRTSSDIIRIALQFFKDV